MMKKLLVIAILGLLISSVFAQKRFEEATIVKNSGEQISGYINYENWNISPRQIEFKLSEQGKSEIYKPGEIQSFSVHGESYQTATVQIETSPRDVNLYNHQAALELEEKTVFLGILYQGKKCLAYYTDEISFNNFYILVDDKYELLIFKSYLVEQNHKTLVQENSKYKGQLMYYLNDCPKVQNQIQVALYNQQSMLKLFKNYQSLCGKETTKVYARNEEVLNKKFGVIAGASISNYHFNTTVKYLSEPDFSTMIGVSSGVFLDMYLPRAKGKWSVNSEIVFHDYQTKGTYEDRYTLQKISIGELNLNINNMARYHLPINNFELFANVGIINSITVAHTNERIYSSPGFNDTEQTGEALVYMRVWKFGVSAGGGISYKHFSLEYRFMESDAIVIFTKPDYWISSSFLYLGYRF